MNISDNLMEAELDFISYVKPLSISNYVTCTGIFI